MLIFLLFILGLAILLLGSNGVIKYALIISRLTKISPLIIGITIVAIGTSLPEITVSFFGGVEKAPDLALGNIIGSNIANIGFILGVSLLVKPIAIDKLKTQNNMLVTLLVSLFLFFTLIFDGLTVIHGLLFIVLGFGYVFFLIAQDRRSIVPEEVTSKSINNSLLFTVTLFILSIVALVIGGKLLVDSGIAFANLFKIPEAIIGITALAIGTSLPELAVSIIGLTRNKDSQEEKLVIGNILGSNIFNILFGAGILGIFGVQHFNSQLSLYAFLFFTLILAFLIYIFRGNEIPKYFGFILLICYSSYLFLLFSGV